MGTDWAGTGAMITGMGSFAGAAAILWAANLGKQAVSDFKSQKIAEKEIDVADRAMVAAYRAAEAVEGIRGKWMPAGELHAAAEELKELGLDLDGMAKSQKDASVQRGLIYRRAEFFKEDFNAIFEVSPSVRSFFGKDKADLLSQLVAARNRVLSSADLLPMASQSAGPLDSEFQINVRRDVFGASLDGTDPIGESVNEAIIKLEEHFLPILRPKNRA